MGLLLTEAEWPDVDPLMYLLPSVFNVTGLAILALPKTALASNRTVRGWAGVISRNVCWTDWKPVYEDRPSSAQAGREVAHSRDAIHASAFRDGPLPRVLRAPVAQDRNVQTDSRPVGWSMIRLG